MPLGRKIRVGHGPSLAPANRCSWLARKDAGRKIIEEAAELAPLGFADTDADYRGSVAARVALCGSAKARGKNDTI